MLIENLMSVKCLRFQYILHILKYYCEIMRPELRYLVNPAVVSASKRCHDF